MRNKMDLLGGMFNGLNLNPIPLEFSQSMTTTKTLAALLAKLDQVINFTNEWYETIITDLEGNGTLYNLLNQEFISKFGTDIQNINSSLTTINTSISSINALITALEYTKPSVTLTTSPNNYLYAVGDTVNSVMLELNIVKGTNNLVKAEIYKNGSLLTTLNTIVNGVNNYVDGTPITTDTSYYVKVFDDKGSVQSQEINFKFVNKLFYGKVADNVIVNDALIQSLNNVNFVDEFQFNISTLNDEKIIIVSYSDLGSVIDSDNYDIIESFTKSILNLNINNVSTPYNVYVSTNTILDNDVKLNIER